MQNLEEHEQKLNALAQINHVEAIEDSVQANVINESSSTPSTDPTKYELKHQLYEKMFKIAAYLTHEKHHAFYDALQESCRSINFKHDTDQQSPLKKLQAIPLTFKDLKMLKNQDKNTRKKFIMMHSVESMLIGSSNLNFLNKDNITKADLEGLTFKLLKNRFKNNIELEYNMEKCHLAMPDKIDWTNPKRERFHIDLSKPLPLEGPPGSKTIPTIYFFNKDLKYLKHGNEEKKYAPSLSKIKPARDNRKWFYKGSIRHPSARDVYSKIKIISVQRITIEKRYGYGYLKEIVVKRTDQKEYTFAEAYFPRLNQNDIEDLYLLKIQDKIHNLVSINEFDLINSRQLYIRRIVIKKRIEDTQLGVESY
ncbi:hypothetical protein Tco_1516367 [Tanacetum coccineum]